MFLSFHHGDADEVATFVQSFAPAFQPLSIGVNDADRLVPAVDEAAFLDKIAAKYLSDSAATIVLLGATTWSRRFIDWEIAATVAATRPPRALLAVSLRSVGVGARLPPRLAELGDTVCVRPYPESVIEVRQMIEDALEAPPLHGRCTPPALLRRDLPLQ